MAPHIEDMEISTRPRLPDPIRAVIFDMDGTLIDTEATQHRIYAKTAEQIGWPLSEDVLSAMVGINRDANERMLAERLGPEFPRALLCRGRRAVRSGGGCRHSAAPGRPHDPRPFPRGRSAAGAEHIDDGDSGAAAAEEGGAAGLL
ncbi:HAD hydrolase-like protein [Novosphingobium panipatense]